MSSPHSVYRTQVLATPVVHKLSVSQLFDVSWNYLLDNLSLAAAYGPAQHIAEYLVTSLLLRLRHGKLRIITPTGRILVFPPTDEADGHTSDKSRSAAIYSEDDRTLTATLVVRRDSFWTRVVFGNMLGLSEAFMCGDVDCDDVSALIELLVVNRQYLTVQSTANRLLSIPKAVTQSRFLPTIGNARANISAHYDLGNVMFEAFLSSEMAYSCPIYSHSQKSDETLEAAQDRKMRRLALKAQIRPGHRVLDLGCGWGGLSILIAQTYPSCHVDAITLSVHQQTYAQQKVHDAGLADRVTVHLMDYREILSQPDWHHAFDRVISCEMVEAIGKEYMEDYWAAFDWALNETDGVGVIQVDSVENIGQANYSRALAEWRTRFLAGFDSKIKPALQDAYKLGPEDLETFRRKWIWYFGYCEQGFKSRMIGCHIITFAREGNPDFLSSP
ncbi:hypothetical protein FRB97_002309 [Tulasnella sp. 331]|nr:hypothetical protein FRB97_002309 [Tulasnella sp. 331]